MDLKLIYNPYTVQTEVFVNGDIKIKKGNKLESFLNSRIQDWDYSNLIQNLFEEFNEGAINIKFKGREMDYEDFELGFENAENPNNIKFTLNFEQGANNKDIINKLKELFKKIEEGPFDELKTPEIKKVFEKSLDSEFPISVLATMSSGKSTLINALLEQQLLPSKNQACTAKITKIKDVDGLEHFSATSYDKDHKQLVKRENITSDDLEDFNNSEYVHEIEIIGDVPNISSDSMNLVIYDTPGPNNSQNEDHGKHAYRMISSDEKPLILYVINGANAATTDDKRLLDKIAEKMNEPGKQSKDRFLFIVNKIDEYDLEKESLDDLLQNVVNYLEDIGIKNPTLFPTSAETAKIIRLHKNNFKLTRDERKTLRDHDDFIDYYTFDKYSNVSDSIRKVIEEKIFSAEDSYIEALYHTGVPSLEYTINEYLTKYALPIKIKKSTESIIRFLDQKNIEKDLKQAILNDENKRIELQEKSKKILEIISNGKKSSQLKEKIQLLKPNKKRIELKKAAILLKIKNIISKFNAESYQKGKKKGLIEKYKVKSLVDKLRAEIDVLLTEISSDTEIIINEEVKESAHKYSEEFKSYITGLLEDFEGVESEMSADFNTYISINFPTESEIQSFCEIRNVKTGTKMVKDTDKKWYKPWTWGDAEYYEVNVYEDVEYTNLEKLLDVATRPLITNSTKNFDDLHIYLDKMINSIKTFFIDEINVLEEELKRKVEEIEEISASTTQLEENLNINKEKTEWLEMINNQIEQIFYS